MVMNNDRPIPKPKPPLDEHYKTLGVAKTTPLAEIKNQWRKLAIQNHPDLCPPAEKVKATERMSIINDAWTRIDDWETHKKWKGDDDSSDEDSDEAESESEDNDEEEDQQYYSDDNDGAQQDRQQYAKPGEYSYHVPPVHTYHVPPTYTYQTFTAEDIRYTSEPIPNNAAGKAPTANTATNDNYSQQGPTNPAGGGSVPPKSKAATSKSGSSDKATGKTKSNEKPASKDKPASKTSSKEKPTSKDKPASKTSSKDPKAKDSEKSKSKTKYQLRFPPKSSNPYAEPGVSGFKKATSEDLAKWKLDAKLNTDCWNAKRYPIRLLDGVYDAYSVTKLIQKWTNFWHASGLQKGTKGLALSLCAAFDKLTDNILEAKDARRSCTDKDKAHKKIIDGHIKSGQGIFDQLAEKLQKFESKMKRKAETTNDPEDVAKILVDGLFGSRTSHFVGNIEAETETVKLVKQCRAANKLYLEECLPIVNLYVKSS